MKTKILFTSMVLPTLFAACTAEDLVENQNVSTDLEGRALLNPITVTVSDATPESRFSWNETTGGWNAFSANDKFSAGLVDDAEGTIQDKVLTNFVYSSTDGKSYTTESQMVEGVYMFYSYKGFESSATRGTVDFNLTSQTADLADPTKTVEDNMLFVTPLYDLEAENANDNLNMKFVSYWSTAAIKLKNANDASFKVVRIILNGNFAAKGSLSPDAMNKAGFIYTYDEDKNAFVLDAANAGKEGQKTYNDFLTANIASSTTTSTELVLDCGSYEVKAGEDVMAYMQVPAGKYSDMTTVNVVVETTDSKGKSILKELSAVVVKNAKNKETDAENNLTAMYRGQTTALFGYNEDKTPKALKVDKVALLSAPDADGLYASSFDDVYKYVTEAEGSYTVDNPLEIYNIGDVKVDDSMVDLLNRMKVVVKFSNPIDIELESTATTINNIVFGDNVTLKKGKVILADNIKTEAELTIEEGTSVKIANGTFVNKIVNKGTIELASGELPQITFDKNSSLVVSSEITWNKAIETYPKAITINKDAVLKGDVSTTSIINIPYTTTVTNNGTLGGGNVKGVVNNGTIINNGTIDHITNANNSEYGSEGKPGYKSEAKITNNGKITEVTLTSGLVVMGNRNASIETITASATGSVDNTVDGFITNANDAVVYAKYSNKTDLQGKLGSQVACNKIILENCTWTKPETSVATIEANGTTLVNKDADGDYADTTLGTVTSFTFKNSTADCNLIVGSVTKITLDGSVFNGTLSVESTLTTLDLVGVTFNGEVTVNNITAININDNDTNANNATPVTTVNATVTSSSSSANTITVSKGAVLEVTSNGTIGNIVESSTISYEGTVNNRGTIKAKSKFGDGTWNGAAIVTE